LQRILIIGCGGAGKSTLARELNQITQLPLYHLDQLYWSPGNWEHLSKEEFDAELIPLLSGERWILDGNYNRTLPLRLERCDTVIYLDYPRHICLFHWLKRVITNWGHAREDMAEGCAEWFDPEFAKWIWNFNRNNRDTIYKLLQQHTHVKKYIFKNTRQLKMFLKRLRQENGNAQ